MSSGISLTGVPVNLADVRGSKVADNLRQAETGKSSEKAQKAARDFEAVLLGHWLEQAEQSFATVPGADEDENTDPGREQYQSIALQAVASSISAGGRGLGIASMVTKHLQKVGEKADVSPEPVQIKDLRGDQSHLGIPLAAGQPGVKK